MEPLHCLTLDETPSTLEYIHNKLAIGFNNGEIKL
jgi:hypothetical protein